MSFSKILQLEKSEGGVALLTLNRPDHRNALSAALRGDIIDCLGALAADPEVGAVVLTGAGTVFCAGFDLKELGQRDTATIFAEARTYHHSVHTFNKPIVAAINGPAMAGGMDLAFMCDIRFGCPESLLGQPQVRMGIPAAYDLMRSVTDESTARYLCLTGNVFAADEALSRGVIALVSPDREQMLTEALACAAQMAKNQAGEAMKARILV
jgi:enoyl-CoA hydratase